MTHRPGFSVSLAFPFFLGNSIVSKSLGKGQECECSLVGQCVRNPGNCQQAIDNVFVKRKAISVLDRDVCSNCQPLVTGVGADKLKRGMAGDRL